MNRIYKSKATPSPTETVDQKLDQYLRQTAPKHTVRNIGKGSLALLAPLAASALIPNQINGQCVFPVTYGASPDLLIDLDGDGLATFIFGNVNANFQYMGVLNSPPGDPGGPLNADIGAASVSGYYYVQHPAGVTTFVTFATLNYFGGDPLTNGGNLVVHNANGLLVTINISRNPSTGVITVNSVTPQGGSTVSPVPTCAMLPLPIELTNFTLESKEKSLQLNWATATESNNKGFEIERSSDGLHFRKVGWVDGAGNSNEAKKYGFEDRSIKTNVDYYYRLKQVDFDGKSSNSNIVRGMVKGDAPIQFGELFPNPISAASFQVEIVSKQEDTPLSYALYDQLGKTVLQGNKNLGAGMNNLRMSVAGVPNGTYYLKMQVGELTEYKKVMVQR